MPLGEEYGGATYFLLETHYDNPSMHQDVIDNSGNHHKIVEKNKIYSCFENILRNQFTCCTLV